MSTAWRQSLGCTCGGFACQCEKTVATMHGVERISNQRDRLQLVTTEVQPTKRAHAKMLKRHAKLNTFVKCPACKQRGGMYYLHTPTETETRWCYYCGYTS